VKTSICKGRPRLRLPTWRESTRDQDASVIEVDFEDACVDKRKHDPGVELKDIVGDPGLDIGDTTERGPALLLHGKPDELERVVLVLGGRREVLAWDGELRATRNLPVEPDHGAPAGSLRRHHGGGLAVHAEGRSFGEALLVLARLLDEERAVQPVRLADAADPNEIAAYLRASISAVACSRVTV
jgi:hypothetical protein